MKNDLRKKAFYTLALLAMFATTIGQKITIDREVRMLALGDSYTIGQSVAIAERWPHQFINQIGLLGIDGDYPDYIATTGWTTRRLIQGIRFMLDREKDYNLVSILIGVNNQFQRIDITSYEPDLRVIIDHALEILSQDTSRLFVLSIPDYAFTGFGRGNANISQEIDNYNTIKKQVAAEYGIAYIDVTSISRLGLLRPPLVASDGLHPSGTQYKEWVQEIIPRLDLDQILSGNNLLSVSENHVSVYPNPTSSILHIDSNLDINRARVFNTLGIMVYDQVLETKPAQLDLSHLDPGFYVMRLGTSNSKQQDIQKGIIVQAFE